MAKLSQTKSAVAARARTRAKMLQAAKDNLARAEKLAAQVQQTKTSSLREYLRSPEGQAKLRELQANVQDMQLAVLKTRASVLGVQMKITQAQEIMARSAALSAR